MFYFIPCDNCKHKRTIKKDGWIFTCDAFPDGRPLNFIYEHNYNEPLCNNHIGFESLESEISS